MFVSFNAHDHLPDHAVRAAGAALALQREVERPAGEHEGLPRLRAGARSRAPAPHLRRLCV